MLDQLHALDHEPFEAHEPLRVVSAVLGAVEEKHRRLGEFAGEVDLAEHRAQQRDVGLKHDNHAASPHALADFRDVVAHREPEHDGCGALREVDEVRERLRLGAGRVPGRQRATLEGRNPRPVGRGRPFELGRHRMPQLSNEVGVPLRDRSEVSLERR